MQPITRETIIDRRQPSLRWSAVFAGALVGVGVWVLLQLFGTGIGLAAVDLTDTGRLRHVAIGASVWTLIAPLVAMFVGGLVAGMFSHTRRSRGGAMHGLIAWALASVAGVIASVWIVSALADDRDGVAFYPDRPAVHLEERAHRTGQALVGAGVSLLLSLGCAVAGGAIGAGERTRRRHDTAPLGVPTVPPMP